MSTARYVVTYIQPGSRSQKPVYLREVSSFGTHWTYDRAQAMVMPLAKAREIQALNQNYGREKIETP